MYGLCHKMLHLRELSGYFLFGLCMATYIMLKLRFQHKYRETTDYLNVDMFDSTDQVLLSCFQFIDFGITEIEAQDFCRSQVQISQSARTCKGIIETNFDLAIDFCVEDLLVSFNIVRKQCVPVSFIFFQMILGIIRELSDGVRIPVIGNID